MRLLLIISIALHVLSSVFWAGSTFVLARSGGAEAAKLFRPQMGAATVAALTGGVLWGMAHRGGFGTMEKVLAAGAAAALTAFAVQFLVVGRGLRAGAAVAVPYRISAGLLMLALICMATARYI